VLRRQLATVHLIRQDDIGAHRLLDRKAARIRLPDSALDAGVGAGEHHFDGVLVNAGLGQQVRERNPGPLRRSHALEPPRLAQRPRMQQ
jgi:hypothetical protein